MKKITRSFSILIAIIMLLSVIYTSSFSTTAATTLTESQFASKLNELRKEYPHGKYWNEYNGVDSQGIAKAGSVVCSGSSNYNGKKCTANGYCAYKGTSCTCKCGYYHGWQCFGFANLMAYKIFGSYATDNYYASGVNSSKGWSHHTSVEQYYAGDVVRINDNHSIFITKVTGSTIYYVECNYDGPCKIDWDNSISLTSLKAKTTFVVRMRGNTLNGTSEAYENNTLIINYNVNGGTILSDILSYNYKVTEEVGINMRETAGTSGSKLTSLPKGTTFTVKYGETKTADGYTWGKTTYDGKTGWVVISDFVSLTSTDRSGDFYVNSSLIYRSSSSSILNDENEYGVYNETGLYNASTFGLEREGYVFVGWSLASTGEEIIDQNMGFKPEEIVPELENGSLTVTVYAIWKSKCEIDGHLYGEWYTVTAPTTAFAGTERRDCACGDYETREIPKLAPANEIKFISHEISGDKVLFTVTTTPDFNRVKVTKADNLASYIAYSSNYTVNADGDYVFSLSVPAIDGVTEYAFDGRRADTNKYAKEYYYDTVEVEIEEKTPSIISATHEISIDKIIFTVVTTPGDFERIKVTTADNLGGSLGVAKKYAVNEDGNYVWTIKIAEPTESTNYAFDLRNATTVKYLKEYFYYEVELAEPVILSSTHTISDGKIIFTVVTKSGDFERIKVTTADNLGGSLGVAKTFTVNEDGNYVWTIKIAEPTENTSYAFDLRNATTVKYLKEYFYYDVEATESLILSASHIISGDKIIFTVVTKAGNYDRIKSTLADNLGGSIAVGNTYTVDENGDYVWTIKATAPTSTTTYAFDLRVAGGRYQKKYLVYSV